MAKNDNAHSVRLTESIRRRSGDAASADFEGSLPLSKSASPEKKHAWAVKACAYLEEHFDADTIVRIRKDCRCNDGKSIANKLLKYLNQAESIRHFVQLFNAGETFAQMEYVSENEILFCYPECCCACVKRIPESLPKTWCYCTLGNAGGIFREVFKRDEIRVTLLQSIKTGADRCAIQVEW